MKNTKLLLSLCGIAVAIAFSSCTKSLTKPPSLSSVNAADGDPVNYGDSLQNGLWAYYKFDGNLADSSGNNRNMTGFNGIGFTTDIDGNANKALNFTGNDTSGKNTYAVCDSGINFTSTKWSVTFLMLTRAQGPGRIFEKADYNNALGASISFTTVAHGTGFGYNLAVTTDPNICTDITTTSNSTSLAVTDTLPLNTWVYVTITYDGSFEKIYLNGAVVSTLTLTSSFYVCNNAPFYVGMWWLSDLQPFNGIMDDLRIYTRALTLGEVQYLASLESTSL